MTALWADEVAKLTFFVEFKGLSLKKWNTFVTLRGRIKWRFVASPYCYITSDVPFCCEVR